MSQNKKINKKFYPYLIYINGKHNTDHYLVDKPERVFEVCLSILEDWNHGGWLQPFNHKKQTLEIYVKERTGLTIKKLEELAQHTKDIKVSLGRYLPTMTVDEILASLKKDFNEDETHDKMVQKAKEVVKKKNKQEAPHLVDYFSSRSGEYMQVRKIYFTNQKEIAGE